MNFELTQEQLLLQKTAREFAQNKLLPGIIERDETSVFPMDLFKEFGKVSHTLFDRSRKCYGIDRSRGHEYGIHIGCAANVKNAQFYFCRQSRNGQHADENQ